MSSGYETPMPIKTQLNKNKKRDLNEFGPSGNSSSQSKKSYTPTKINVMKIFTIDGIMLTDYEKDIKPKLNNIKEILDKTP